MIGPASRLTQRIEITATKEIRLHIQLLNRQLAPCNTLMYPLVTGIEAANMARHCNQTRFELQRSKSLSLFQIVCHRNLYQDMLASAEGLHRL